MDALFESLLFSKALISLAELDIGDISIEAFRLAECQRFITMVVAVCRELLSSKVVFFLAKGAYVLFAPTNIGARFSWS
jgi:hypothetical protein